MKLSPGTAGFTVFLAALTAVGPLSTDMYLPSLPDIGRDFNADAGTVQLTLSAHLIAFAGSQLFYGPLADRYGRRPVLMGGFLLFMAGCFASLFVATIDQLILARILQAVGGGASVVLARAIVRDLFEGPEAGQMLAKMAAIMGLVPAAAPMLGGVVQDLYGWKANFIAMGGFGAVLLVMTLVNLEETLPAARRQSAAPLAILRSYRRLLMDRRFLRYLAIASLAFCGLFAFVSGSSFVMQGIYGLSPIVYGLIFGAMAGGYVAGSITGGRLVRKLGIDGTLRFGGFCAALGGLLMLTALMLTPSALAIALPVVIYGFAMGATMPQAMAGALTPFPDIAGTASSLLGFLQSAAGALAGVYVGYGSEASAMPMVAVIAAGGASAFAIAMSGRGKKA
ncbi:multidrug effflux MFS transporter [Parvibaculum sp.]|jgi:DHA1 family bicyclomycin/chloramphenicol resistance-like MFS transporter|uniref:multidrug effflux MFS transporter n=1 Tax=Parvibaculum sp. TaxID=2024848 RepID=UPI000C4EBED7|nr:multidrug effflux MFS transporter [Parvibaculum sp.]MAU61443.1 multidrug transporter [Parvibaculum sp.]MBO6668283.1 multidrug effflux MFS transporter [Parvibaculum sp.]MBO6691027.1 multidrug effflux MFS transporter [Parvibaculum sp.]MBO6714599.1 multidrug effflux MFS transporter [Parvibaculum sp.]|tara:strand:- start:3261 stop:4445 length:1185 start_codon:yes stop_codon:yes gene_type:complete